jgi:hypothetical protein
MTTLLNKGLPLSAAILLALALPHTGYGVSAAFNLNLVENPGAELGAEAKFGEDLVIPAWENGMTYGAAKAGSVNTAATAQAYGLHAVQAPNAASLMAMTASATGTIPAPTPGTAYFYGGGGLWTANNGVAEGGPGIRPMAVAMRQTINVSGLDLSESLGYDLSAWFGGWNTTDSSGFVDARFLDANGNELGNDRIGGVRATDRGNNPQTWINSKSDSFVPEGTKTVQIDVWFDTPMASGCTCLTGSEAGVDNVSFLLRSNAGIPEPASASIAAVGLSLLLRRRRKL